MTKAEKKACEYTGYCKNQSYSDFLAGYQQAEKDLTWHKAQGNDLPPIDKEVIALQGLKGGGVRIVFAHRPQESWVGVSIGTRERAIHRPKRYGKGKWNMPNVRYWLNLDLPKRYDTTE